MDWIRLDTLLCGARRKHSAPTVNLMIMKNIFFSLLAISEL
ncbi:hypothetical protein BACDOR_02197 [Phocaeicola dorei DSM 17855]|uniref:Uncharacterized protein n=1 Tax=Phocaeicola dorei DSM 17855 TaxID=483217 RepID=B6VY36_9BACT|nr:hypothetical protein BACDOR_02197 [Phocaeicola dorei DSM 17855]